MMEVIGKDHDLQIWRRYNYMKIWERENPLIKFKKNKKRRNLTIHEVK